MTGEVTFEINGVVLSGITAITVEASIGQVARTFSISLANVPGNLDIRGNPLMKPFAVGDIRYDDELVATVGIDVLSGSWTAGSYDLAIKGRSLTADIIDSGVRPPWTLYDKITLPEYAEKICSPYGVPVKVEAPAEMFPRMDALSASPGQKVVQVLERYSRQIGVWLMDDVLGQLVITTVDDSPPIGSLVLGKNILSGQIDVDVSSRFREYILVGQEAGTGLTYGSSGTIESTVRDETVPESRDRRKYMPAETGVDLKRAADRAEWETVVTAGRSTRLIYTVPSWRSDEGFLWEPNRLVSLRDYHAGVDRTLLISKVTYSYSSGGLLATLTLTSPDAYKLVRGSVSASNVNYSILNPSEGDGQ